MDLAAAHFSVVEAARDIMSAQISQGRLPLSWFIEIQDADRETLTLVPFASTVAIGG